MLWNKKNTSFCFKELKKHFSIFLSNIIVDSEKFPFVFDNNYLDTFVLYQESGTNPLAIKLTDKYSILGENKKNFNLFNNFEYVEKWFKNKKEYKTYNEYAQFNAYINLIKDLLKQENKNKRRCFNNACRGLLLGILYPADKSLVNPEKSSSCIKIEFLKSISNIDHYLDCIYEFRNLTELNTFFKEIEKIVKDDEITQLYLEKLKKIILEYPTSSYCNSKKEEKQMNILKEAIKLGDFEEVQIWFKRNPVPWWRDRTEVIKLAEMYKNRTDKGCAINNFIKGRFSSFTDGKRSSSCPKNSSNGLFFINKAKTAIKKRNFDELKIIVDALMFTDYPHIINYITDNLRSVVYKNVDFEILNNMYNYTYIKFVNSPEYKFYNIQEKTYIIKGKKYSKFRIKNK